VTAVSSLWIGDSLSPLERACVQSFLNRGYQFDLYAYEPIAHVPAGCRVLDAAGILPESSIIRYARGPGKGSVALFANMFRYKLLHEVGGWWVDMDMFCLSQTLPDTGVVLAQEDRNGLNCAIMRFPQGHDAMRVAYDECVMRSDDVDWGDTGPRLLTRLATQFGLTGSIFPEPVFYPIHFSNFWLIFDPRRTTYAAEKIRSAACVHLWHNLIGRAGLDLHVRPPAGSLLYNMYEWTIGTANFAREYVLAPEAPMDSVRLQIRPCGGTQEHPAASTSTPAQ